MNIANNLIDLNDRRSSPDIAIYQVVGGRQEQEDRYAVARVTGGVLLMIADGHGNEKTANLIANNVTQLFTREREQLLRSRPNGVYGGLSPANERLAIRRTIYALITLTQDQNSGSTLTLVFLQVGTQRINDKYILKLRAHVGQMGDSVFALSAKPGSVSIAPMHSVVDASNDVAIIQKQYEEKYGQPCQVNGNYIHSSIGGAISLTRALGDENFILIRKPVVKTYEADPKTAKILLASDGLYDSPKQAKKTIRGAMAALRAGSTVQELGERIVRKHDNLTLISVCYPADA